MTFQSRSLIVICLFEYFIISSEYKMVNDISTADILTLHKSALFCSSVSVNHDIVTTEAAK